MQHFVGDFAKPNLVVRDLHIVTFREIHKQNYCSFPSINFFLVLGWNNGCKNCCYLKKTITQSDGMSWVSGLANCIVIENSSNQRV